MQYRTTAVFRTAAPLTPEQTAALTDAIGAGSIVTAGPDAQVTVELTVTGRTLADAAALGHFDASAALIDQKLIGREAGAPVEPVFVSAAEATWHTAQTVAPGMPGTVQITDITDILGVSQQRASQLAADDPAFPAPLNPGHRPRLWDKAAIHAYAKRPRRPGRPRTNPR